MADPDKPATEPPKVSQLTIPRKCPHCGDMKAVGHISNCAKNPARAANIAKRNAKKVAGAKKPAAKAAAKPAKPAADKPKDKQEEFLARERKSLQAEAAPPAAAPPAADKPKKKGSSWGLMVVAGLGLLWLLYMFFTAPEPGKAPRERRAEPEPQPELKANAHVPGIGSFHVPGLREA